MKRWACAGPFPGEGPEAVRAQEEARQDVIVVRGLAGAAQAREASTRPLRVLLPGDPLARDPGILASEIAAAVRAGAAEVGIDGRAALRGPPERREVLVRVLEAVRPAAGAARLVLDVAAPPLAPETLHALQASGVDVLHVDVAGGADPRLLDLVAAAGTRKTLSFGLVSGEREEEEREEALRALLEAVLPQIATKEAYLATRAGLEAVLPERARACALALARLRDALAAGAAARKGADA